MSNPCVDVVVKELVAAGVRHEVRNTSKHIHVLYGPELQHMHVCAATPSDWRAPRNERAQIRRELKTLGFICDDDVPELEHGAVVRLVDGRPTCTSTDLAATFDKEHKNVLQSIDRVRVDCGVEFDRLNFQPIEYVDGKGRTFRAYRMTRDGYAMVAMGFTGAKATTWKVKFLTAFNAMEMELSRLAAPTVDLSWVRREFDAVVALIGEVEARASRPAPAAPFIPTRREIRRERRRALRKWRAAA